MFGNIRQVLFTMFVANNHASFELWWKENLVNFPQNITSMVVGDNRFSIKPLDKLIKKYELILKTKQRNNTTKQSEYVKVALLFWLRLSIYIHVLNRSSVVLWAEFCYCLFVFLENTLTKIPTTVSYIFGINKHYKNLKRKINYIGSILLYIFGKNF